MEGVVWNIGFMVGCFELSVVLRMRGTLNPAASVRERPSLCFLRTKARTLPSFSFLAFSLDPCAVEMCSRRNGGFGKIFIRSGEATELLLKSPVLPANTMETNEGEL